jgi:16S rRNA C1402 (ribose-2'-O) methylase RsmI
MVKAFTVQAWRPEFGSPECMKMLSEPNSWPVISTAGWPGTVDPQYKLGTQASYIN